ncbi:MAG: hypothetical protein AAF183_12950 [Pseudomonadota bacterium]
MSEAVKCPEAKPEPARSVVRVRDHLIKPLLADGLRKARATPSEQHDAFLEKLEKRLNWMSAAGLDALRVSIIDLAEGRSRNVWPSWATIWNTARVLERPPADRHDMVMSYLRSEVGMRALDASPWHPVALRWFLVEFGPLRASGTQECWRTKKINDRARQLAREWESLSEARTPSDIERRTEMAAERDEVRAIVRHEVAA